MSDKPAYVYYTDLQRLHRLATKDNQRDTQYSTVKMYQSKCGLATTVILMDEKNQKT